MSKSPGHTSSPELKSPSHTLYLRLEPARSLILTSYCYLPLICILLPVLHPPPGPTERYLVSTLPQNTPKIFRPAASHRAHLSCLATLFLPSPTLSTLSTLSTLLLPTPLLAFTYLIHHHLTNLAPSTTSEPPHPPRSGYTPC